MMGLVSELKRDGRGAFFDAGNLDDLLAALRKSLALSKYEVFPLDGHDPGLVPLELNKPCEIKPLVPGPFQVQLVDAHAAGDCQCGPRRRRMAGTLSAAKPWGLVHKRYDREQRDFCDRVPDPANPDRAFWIGAHLPKWVAGGIEFYVSVQNGDAAGFSPRPCEAWVEITPVAVPSQPNEPKKFVFYDMSFQADRPVPVLRCSAPRWPKQAEEAEIEVWCKFRPTVDEEVTLGKLKQFHVSDVPDVRFDVKTVRSTGGGLVQDRDQRVASQGRGYLPAEGGASGRRSGPGEDSPLVRSQRRRSGDRPPRVLPGGQSVIGRYRQLRGPHHLAETVEAGRRDRAEKTSRQDPVARDSDAELSYDYLPGFCDQATSRRSITSRAVPRSRAPRRQMGIDLAHACEYVRETPLHSSTRINKLSCQRGDQDGCRRYLRRQRKRRTLLLSKMVRDEVALRNFWPMADSAGPPHAKLRGHLFMRPSRIVVRPVSQQVNPFLSIPTNHSFLKRVSTPKALRGRSLGRLALLRWIAERT